MRVESSAHMVPRRAAGQTPAVAQQNEDSNWNWDGDAFCSYPVVLSGGKWSYCLTVIRDQGDNGFFMGISGRWPDCGFLQTANRKRLSARQNDVQFFTFKIISFILYFFFYNNCWSGHTYNLRLESHSKFSIGLVNHARSLHCESEILHIHLENLSSLDQSAPISTLWGETW